MQEYKVTPIGKITVNEDGSFIILDEKYLPALKALDGFSHLNVIWWFSDFDSDEMRAFAEKAAGTRGVSGRRVLPAFPPIGGGRKAVG